MKSIIHINAFVNSQKKNYLNNINEFKSLEFHIGTRAVFIARKGLCDLNQITTLDIPVSILVQVYLSIYCCASWMTY